MPSAQNKKIRMFGPWRGLNDQESRVSTADFESSFNIEYEGEEIRTRPGRHPITGGIGGTITAITELGGNPIIAIYNSGPRLYRVQETISWVQIANPAGITASDRWDAFAHWGTNIVLCGGSGAVVVFDGTSLAPLTAVPGQDASTTAYLASLPAAKWAAKYHERLFLVTAGGTVVFSEADNALNIIPFDGSAPLGGANVWPASNNFDAKAQADDEAAGVAVFGDQLVLPTREALFVYDELQLRKVPGAPGCVAPRSLAETPKGLCYLASDGVRLFTGNSANRISERVDETLKAFIARPNVKDAVGVHVPHKHQYRLYLPTIGSTKNDLCLVWDYDDNRWTVHGGTPYWMPNNVAFQEMEVAAAAVLYASSDQKTLITGDYAGKLWAEDTGFTDNGKRIFSLVAFKRIGLGEDTDVRLWRDVRVEAKATGAPIKVALVADGPDFRGGDVGQGTLFSALPTTATALHPYQSTWKAYPSEAPSGATYSPVPPWASFRVPFAKVSRTVQPIVWCDGVDSNGVTRGGRMIFRGIEVQYRPHGRRSAA